MRRRLRTALMSAASVAMAASTLTSTDCFLSSHSCAAIGCFDDAMITFRTPNASWTAGTYTLDLNVDGAPSQCTLAVPDSPQGGAQGTCSSGASFALEQEVTCTTTCSGNVCTRSCAPIRGQFHLRLDFRATPTHVALTLSRDGNQLASQSVKVKYTATEPNGQGCGFCHQASLDVPLNGT